MLFDAATPDTSVYMIAGYAIFTLVAAIYIISLFVRARNLQRDRAALEGLHQEQKRQDELAAFSTPAKPRRPAANPPRRAEAQARKKTARKTSRKR